jgi:predicted metal-dependent hydrolase
VENRRRAAIIEPMAEQKTKAARASAKRPRKTAASAPLPQVVEPEPELPRGRTPALDPKEQHELLHKGVALFNGLRYWHAHEAWEALWRAADDDDRDFYQGLIQVAAGLLHLQRRNARGARNKLREGLARLRPYEPSHRGIFLNELIGQLEGIEQDLQEGQLPYLIPPVIRFADVERAADFNR